MTPILNRQKAGRALVKPSKTNLKKGNKKRRCPSSFQTQKTSFT